MQASSSSLTVAPPVTPVAPDRPHAPSRPANLKAEIALIRLNQPDLPPAAVRALSIRDLNGYD